MCKNAEIESSSCELTRHICAVCNSPVCEKCSTVIVAKPAVLDHDRVCDTEACLSTFMTIHPEAVARDGPGSHLTPLGVTRFTPASKSSKPPRSSAPVGEEKGISFRIASNSDREAVSSRKTWVWGAPNTVLTSKDMDLINLCKSYVSMCSRNRFHCVLLLHTCV